MPAESGEAFSLTAPTIPVNDRLIAPRSTPDRGEAQCHDAAGFRDYCELRARIEAKEWAAIRGADLPRYRMLDSVFQTARFDALYQRWRQVPDAPVTSVEVATARHLDCVLRIHPLGDRYCISQRTKTALRG